MSAAAGFDAERLGRRVADLSFVRGLTVLERVGSTNDALRRLADAGAPEGSVVVADCQTAGRGRQGRAWHSPPGTGLYVSLLVRNVGPDTLATRWTLAAAVACCEACAAVTGAAPTIKWPNDVELDGRKLAGILAELRAGGGLVLGTGINVGQTAGDFPGELAGRATSLALAGHAGVDREALLVAYLERFGECHGALTRGDWEPIRDRWLRLAPGARDQPVVVTRGDRVFSGHTRGIDASGGLRVEDDAGRIGVVRLADAVRPAGPSRGA